MLTPALQLPLPKIFVIGDSISVHYGPWLKKFLNGKFDYDHKQDAIDRRAADNLDIPQGANGGDSGMVLAYLRDRKTNDPIKADLLMLNCGLHDIKVDPKTGSRQIKKDQYGENLHSCLIEAAAMNLEPVWITTTPVLDAVHNTRMKGFHRFSADVAAYNEIANRVMKENDVPVIDLFSFSEQFLPDGFCDHVHFNEEVRCCQAAFIAGWLNHWSVTHSVSSSAKR